jgi:hypothetical protein
MMLKLSAFFATGSLVLYLSNYYQIYFVGKMMKGEAFADQLPYVILFVGVSFVAVYIGGKLLMWAGKKLRGKMIIQEEEGSARGASFSRPSSAGRPPSSQPGYYPVVQQEVPQEHP